MATLDCKGTPRPAYIKGREEPLCGAPQGEVIVASEKIVRKKAPVFVLGAPRSGTTLLYHMLLSAGGFAIYRTESNVFNLLAPRFGDLSALRNKRKLMEAWLRSKLFVRSGLNAEDIQSKIFAECKSAGDFLRIVMEEIARKQDVDRWADCTPDHLLYLPQIKRAFPEALVIHIIRDGRDVALSLNKQGWIRPFPWHKERGLIVAGLFWEWIVGNGLRHGRKLASGYVEVRFEDLMAKPRETLAKLSTFIDHDLDYDHIRQVGIGSVSEPNTSFPTESHNSAFNPVGRWKHGFSHEQLVMFERLVGPLLEELNYPLATSHEDSRDGFKLKGMRALYRLFFDSKLWLRSKTPLGRILITKDLSWL
jgi:hypothetical protein